MRGSRTCLAAVGLALLVPSTAMAQSDGVVVDPDSPTAKQYAIPIESARRQADPKNGQIAPPGTESTANSAALFGEGITPASSARQSRARKSGGSYSHGSDSNSKRPTAAAGSDASEGDSPVRAAISNPGAPSGGIGSSLLIAGGGLLVLLVGAMAGFALRRRSAD